MQATLFNNSPTLTLINRELNPDEKRTHEKAVARAKRYLIAEAELLEAIMEVDRCRLFESFSLTHLTPYCVKILGLSEDVAACFVRVARKSKEVPEIKTAIDEGKLTVTKAKTIVSVVNQENKTEWIERASTLSKAQLEKEVAEESPSKVQPEKAKLKGPNRIRVEFELTEEEMQLFRRAQNILSQKKKHFVSMAEAQKELLECFLEKHDPLRKAERAKDRSRDQSTKSIPAKIIHEVNLRDKGKCQARLPDGTICQNPKWVHYHHIKPQSEGGAHTIENLITLCSSHHRQWHRRI